MRFFVADFFTSFQQFFFALLRIKKEVFVHPDVHGFLCRAYARVGCCTVAVQAPVAIQSLVNAKNQNILIYAVHLPSTRVLLLHAKKVCAVRNLYCRSC